MSDFVRDLTTGGTTTTVITITIVISITKETTITVPADPVGRD